MNEWLTFYAPYFEKQDEAEKFVESCERQSYPSNVAKIMMHQTQRLILLSDDMQKIRPNDDPLKLLILIMCVENIAKLHNNYTGEHDSKKYVKKFFDDFLSKTDKDLLSNGFIDGNDKWSRPLSFEKVINMFYKIRCDVVHEGDYLDFSFYNGKTDMLEMVDSYAVTPRITISSVRDIIIRGCINAIQSKL